MRKALACGIDFGTTNSSVSIAYDNGEVELVTIDQSTTMPYSLPSIVYIDRDNFRRAGQEAVKQFMITGALRTACANCDLVQYTPFAPPSTNCKQFLPGGGCQDARLISGLKSLLAPTEKGKTHSWARDFELEDFVAIIIKEIKGRVDSIADENISRVVLGYPVVFVGAEGPNHQFLQKRAKGRLRRAAEIAGFKDIELFSEPEAVLLDKPSEDGYVIAADFGGGTYDVAVLENRDGKAKIVGRQGVAVGGEIFDGLLFDDSGAEYIGINQKAKAKNLSLPNWITQNMRTLSGIPQLLQKKKLEATLTFFEMTGINTDAIRRILFGGQAYNFYDEIEQGKMELSKSQVAQLSFQIPGMIPSPTVYRADFDRWISSYLDKVVDATLAALNEAGITPQDVNTVLRTGGSSEIPQFIDRLETIFPNAEIKERDVFTSVAYGLGLHALEVWGDDKQLPSLKIRVPTTKELVVYASAGQSQQDAPQEHKGVRSWIRRFWMWLKRVVWRKRKVLKTPRPDEETVVREDLPDGQDPRDVETSVSEPSSEPVIGDEDYQIQEDADSPEPDIGTEPSLKEEVDEYPYDTRKKILTVEEEACAAARNNALKYGHEVGEFVERIRLDKNKEFSAKCQKCGLSIEAVVEFDTNSTKGLPRVGGTAKNARCAGVGSHSSGTS